MRKKLVGYYDYTVILTYCGMLFAFDGILKAISGDYWGTMVCLMIAGVCDMFDGTVASTKERTTPEKRFGIQIDSLSDLISFGVLPGIFLYMISERTLAAALISTVFALCALIRLAYFNVLEEERQKLTTEKRESYLGVPVTTIAILLPAAYLLYDSQIIKNQIIFSILMIMIAIGFLLPIKVKKPKIIGKICIIFVGILEMIGMAFLVLRGAI